MIPNAPETHQSMSLVSNGVDRVHLLQKFRCNFLARTFALIVPVWPVLDRDSCSKKMIPNAPKHYEMHQNMSLGSYGADWVHSLRKIPKWLRGTNVCINCTSSTHFAPSLMQLRNDPKCTQTLWKAPKHEFRVQWVDQVRLLRKISMQLHDTNFCINCTSLARFAPSFLQ